MHGRPGDARCNHGVVPRHAGLPLLAVGVPSVACGVNNHDRSTAGTVDRAPYRSGGTF